MTDDASDQRRGEATGEAASANAPSFAEVLAALDAAASAPRQAVEAIELEPESGGPDEDAPSLGQGGGADIGETGGHVAPSPEAEAAARQPRRARLVLVTGRAGAGRTTAINALEDLGFERIDTPPLGFVPAILRRLTETEPRQVAIGVSSRSADFSTENFNAMRDMLDAMPDLDVSVVFLDGADEALRRRYAETRRRHPLSPEGGVEDGLAMDRQIMLPLRSRADIVIDTSELTPAELRRALHRHLSDARIVGPTLSIMSFAYRRGLPVDADLVFDCRFLRNPHYDVELKPKDGRDPAVAAYVAADERYDRFVGLIEEQAALLLPAFAAEGKSYVTIAFGCTGGRHRSVTLAEAFGRIATGLGWRPLVRHRELDRAEALEQDG